LHWHSKRFKLGICIQDILHELHKTGDQEVQKLPPLKLWNCKNWTLMLDAGQGMPLPLLVVLGGPQLPLVPFRFFVVLEEG